MHLIGLPKLDEFKQKHIAEHGPLDAWRAEIEIAQWEDISEIERYYPTADITTKGKVTFLVNGKTCQIALKVRFQNKIILIDWIGTRSELGGPKTNKR